MKLLLLLSLLSYVISTPTCVCDSTQNIQNTGFSANDFVCIDDTSFKHFISPTDFVIKRCAVPGSCFTRKPPKGNPCIGKELAQQIDGI